MGAPRLQLLIALGALVAGTAFAADDAERAKLEFFEKEIRPLLATHCYECHGEKKQKSGLRLDHIGDILRGGETGPALVRGDVEKSLLIEAVRHKNEDLQMPPSERGRLDAADIARLEKWVALGAPWPTENVARVVRDEHGFTAEARAFWTFQPLKQSSVPTAGAGWARNDIDRFVAAKHTELGLAPSPAADRAELARRVYFDLHGLPPTREQLAAFVSDSSPGAYERLVDTLLASPRYGERWAQHWLDLVRYAESDGYRADALRPSAWPYRDYVISSLNSDKPYDQFVREQLAGDEMAPDKPEVLVATSYLRNPIYEWNQRDVRGQAELILNDLTDNAGEVFLGLSFGCARCHDHKFDPILQKDYFALRAFFQPVNWRTDLTLSTPEERARHAQQTAEWEKATANIRAQMDALVGPALKNAVKKAHDRFTDDLQAMMGKSPAARAPDEHVLATIAERQLQYERDNFDPQKTLKVAAEKARYRELEVELKKFDAIKPKPLLPAFVATDAGPRAPVTMMKSKKGEREVLPGFLTLIEPNSPKIVVQENSTGRRTALANWITRPDNQLTTRVMVNRIWQYHFGRGLAGTPNDLGHLGDRPTHPELLDWLAQRFVAGGWRFKSLHRDILLSATYQQTARVAVPEKAAMVDPTNKYLRRFSPRRLDAEQARDAMLAASGELDLTAGGPSQDAATSPRRSIYTTKKRNNQNEFLRSLDAPAGFTSIADRQQTATPVQALLLMNGEWPLARARKLAANSPTVESAWQATLGRAPAAEEMRHAKEFVEKRARSTDERAPVSAGPIQVVAGAPGRFHENTLQERLIVRNAPKEGDEFTVEAIITLDSIDTGASVRTIASRWTGDKASIEGHGWSFGVTGAKSGYKPRNLIMQLVGEDDNMNTGYEVAASGLHLELRTRYHVVAKVSTNDHTVTFHVRDLSKPNGERQTAVAKQALVGKFGLGQAGLVIGGLNRRGASQFDGQIDAVRVVSGVLPDADLSSDPARWGVGGVAWQAKNGNVAGFEWAGGAALVESADPRVRAMTDLCHVLLNSNEFLYLH